MKILITIILLLSLSSCKKILEELHKKSNNIIIAEDITAGRESCWTDDSVFILQTIEKLDPGDAIHILYISALSESHSTLLVDLELSDMTGSYGSLLKDAKDSLIAFFNTKWGRMLSSLSSQKFNSQTDLVGFFNVAKQYYSTSKRNTIYMLSDMQEVQTELGINFERNIPKLSLINQLKAKNLLPNLQGFDIYVLNCTNTHNITNEHWRSIKDFWAEFFKNTRAALKLYSSSISLNEGSN